MVIPCPKYLCGLFQRKTEVPQILKGASHSSVKSGIVFRDVYGNSWLVTFINDFKVSFTFFLVCCEADLGVKKTAAFSFKGKRSFQINFYQNIGTLPLRTFPGLI